VTKTLSLSLSLSLSNHYSGVPSTCHDCHAARRRAPCRARHSAFRRHLRRAPCRAAPTCCSIMPPPLHPLGHSPSTELNGGALPPQPLLSSPSCSLFRMALAVVLAAASGHIQLHSADDSLIYHLGCSICYPVVAALAVAAAAVARVVGTA
jgi:hypothetical protein